MPLFLLVPIAAAVAISLLLGGDPRRLADVRLRYVWLALAALAAQIAIITLAPGGAHWLHVWIHISTYVIALLFVIANLKVPGLWLVGLGGACNALAIATNSGVMPASEAALRSAGLADHAGFLNSTSLPHAHLAFLGDVFAIPAWMPLHNVFSIGDVLIAVGIIAVVVSASGASLPFRRLDTAS